MIYYLSPYGRCGLEHYVAGRWRTSNVPEIEVLTYEDVLASHSLPFGTWIFAGVEQLPPSGRRLAELLWQTVRDAGCPALNRPMRLPSRHGLLEKMHRSGINEFRSCLPDEIDDSLRYPVFVREAEDHTGNLSELIYSRHELDSFLRWQKLRGYKLHELLVIEFCDTANKSREYRKYSAQCVQGEVAARYLHVDDQWMVKAHGSTFREKWVQEEYEFICENAHADEVRKIFDMANIDFGRIDYGLLDDKIQVWEINTNPTIGGPPSSSGIARTPKHVRKLVKPGRQHFFAKFQTMLEHIDSTHDPNATMEFTPPEDVVDAWRNEVQLTKRLLRRRQLIRNISAWRPVELARDFAKNALNVTTH